MIDIVQFFGIQTAKPAAPKCLRVYGIDRKVNVCECCGKRNLRYTVILSDDGQATEKRFGRDCAAREMWGSYSPDNSKRMVKLAEGIDKARRHFRDHGRWGLSGLVGFIPGACLREDVGGFQWINAHGVRL